MPRIPTITSEVGIGVGAPDTRASPEAFGAGIGRATQGIGNVLAQTSNDLAQREAQVARKAEVEQHQQWRDAEAQLEQFRDARNAETLANARANTDLGSIARKVQQEGPPDGSGVAEETYLQQRNFIDEKADQFADPIMRSRYKAAMYNEAGNWRDRQVDYEFQQAEKHSREQASVALDNLNNGVRDDIALYDTNLTKAYDVINARSGITSLEKEAMRNQVKSNFSQARFEAGMSAANTSADFDILKDELTSDKWRGSMTAAAYDQVQGQLKAAHNSFLSGQDAAARAQLDSMETRTKSRELISEAEMQEMTKLAENAKSPAVSIRAMRVADQQRLLRTYGNAPPSQLNRTVNEMRGQETLRGDVATWSSNASRITGGEISASYLVNKLSREYPRSAIEAGKYDIKSGTSNAQGLFQFIPSTWRGMVNKYGATLGIYTKGMSDAQILELRNDPQVSTNMAALYAKENKDILKREFSVEPTDADLYLAHFLGPAGAITFLKAMRAGPNDPITATGALSQAAIDANTSVLKGKSYKEVYDNVAASFIPGTTGAQFDQIDYLTKMGEDKAKSIKDDPITQYTKDGRMQAYELDSPEAFQTRARDAVAAASYYTIPTTEMKPFTSQEADNISKNLREGDANQTLQIMAQVYAMDKVAPGMAKAAMVQLGEKDSVYGYAATLAVDIGDAATASAIIKGQKIIQADGTAKAMFADANAPIVSNSYYNVVGDALSGLEASARAPVLEAAKAHYAYSHAGKSETQIDEAAFEASVTAVLGSTIGDVNDNKTLLPPGLDEDTFNDGVDNMSDTDLIDMSVDKVAPMDLDGSPITAQDIANEGRFVSIGGDYYRIEMTDGGIVSTGRADPANNQNVRWFIFKPDAERMKWLAQRTVDNIPSSSDPGSLPFGIGVP
jgi:hypothetical protein